MGLLRLFERVRGGADASDETFRRKFLRPARLLLLAVGITVHMTDTDGIAGSALSDADLLRELEVLHSTRHETFRHAAEQALDEHTRRTAALEAEYLLRFPDREIDPLRTRFGSRAAGGDPDPAEVSPAVRTGAEQPWDPEDLAVAEGRDPTPANIERAKRELAAEGPAAIERTVP